MRTAKRRIRGALAARRCQRAKYSAWIHAQASPYAAGAPRGIFNLAWGWSRRFCQCCGPRLARLPAAIAATMGKQHSGHGDQVAHGAAGIIGLCGIKGNNRRARKSRRSEVVHFVANHQSFFDIFAAAAFIPGEPRFVAKKGAAQNPGGRLRDATRRSRDPPIPRLAARRFARRSRSFAAALTSASSPRAIASTTTGSTVSNTPPRGSRSCRSCRRCRCRSAGPA